MKQGLILFAHGSRDPLWCLPMEAVADAIRARDPEALVCCAYLELCHPDLALAATNLIAEGADCIRAFPLFFGLGKHALEYLPALLEQVRAQHPGVPVELMQTAGEHPQLIALLADIAMS